MYELEYPEALHLADLLERCDEVSSDHAIDAAHELRRLYREVQRLQDKLDNIHYQNSMKDNG